MSQAGRMTTRAAAMVDLDRLTPREEQCLRDVADGLTSKQIGRRRTMSPRTADTHIYNALKKLGLRDREEAAAL